MMALQAAAQASTFGRPTNAARASAWHAPGLTTEPSTRRSRPTPARSSSDAAALPTAPTPMTTTNARRTCACPSAPRKAELRESCSNVTMSSSVWFDSEEMDSDAAATVLPQDTNPSACGATGSYGLCAASLVDACISLLSRMLQLGEGISKLCSACCSAFAMRLRTTVGTLSGVPCDFASASVARIKFPAVIGFMGSHTASVNCWPDAPVASISGLRALLLCHTSWTMKSASASVTSKAGARPPL
mmetsp:Transcript_44478/g.88140  ORF Transcript_44478/g.88140 Transcript_44478/m.88140 type:complete len:246 (+) Transcript_44478:2664-3401(+)